MGACVVLFLKQPCRVTRDLVHRGSGLGRLRGAQVVRPEVGKIDLKGFAHAARCITAPIAGIRISYQNRIRCRQKAPWVHNGS